METGQKIPFTPVLPNGSAGSSHVSRPAPSQPLGADRFPNFFQLTLYRAVVNRAAYADNRSAQQGCIQSKLCAHFLARCFFDLRFEGALLSVAQLPRTGDLGFGESHSRVEFSLKLLCD